MDDQIRWRLRETVAAKMLGRADNGHLHIGRNAHCDHAAADLRPKTHPGIKPLCNNIDKPTFANKFQPDIRIALLEHRQLRQKDFINRMLAGVNADGAGRRVAIIRQSGKPRIQCIKARFYCSIELLAGLGK